MLLLVYPFQVALAMADRCCATTPSGPSHHGVAQQRASAAAQAVLAADDGHGASADPHCAACVFGHIHYLPSGGFALPPPPHHAERVRVAFAQPASAPRSRLERPKWPRAAD